MVVSNVTVGVERNLEFKYSGFMEFKLRLVGFVLNSSSHCDWISRILHTP